MKKQIMPIKLCLKKNKCDGTLHYYHEANNGNDLYYCNRCFGLAEWNGISVHYIAGEAYPLRSS